MSLFRLTFAACLVGLAARQGQALVIGAPGFGANFFTVPAKEQAAEKSIKLRIRTTRESDINDVTNILANALVDPYGEAEGGFNFKFKMDLLKSKSGVESLLLSRVHAINTGMRLGHDCPLDLSETDKLRFLWSNDGFRNKMKKAAHTSTEPHIWNHHNFACAPGSPCWLQHKMITAEDAESGEIVGFCEVAMLSEPSEDENGDEQGSLEVAPTIVNLAIASKYRRRGIASRLTKTAARFVRNEWSSDELSLYVDKENDAAVAMYKNLGFERKAEVESRSQWYMTRQLGAAAEMVRS
jgi:ribosomal protein S18 acetylase RimI-like enzyme